MKTNRTSHYLIIVAIAALGIIAACSGQEVQSAIPQTSNSGRVCEAAKMNGRDIGAKVNECDKVLGSNRGEILLAGGGIIQTQIVISPQHTLRVLSFKYDTPTARMYTTIGSLDHPESAPIIKQYGIESRLPWVKFCEDVPAERTGESAAAQEFLATMQDRQSRD